jgi:hypothetical protein
MTRNKAALHNPLEDLIGYQLRRASLAFMDGMMRSLEVCELKPVEASVLLLIEANPGITQSEIGRALGIQRTNIAPWVAGFDRRGLVHRTRLDYSVDLGLLPCDYGVSSCNRNCDRSSGGEACHDRVSQNEKKADLRRYLWPALDVRNRT